jgi:hypothetical protein
MEMVGFQIWKPIKAAPDRVEKMLGGRGLRLLNAI